MLRVTRDFGDSPYAGWPLSSNVIHFVYVLGIHGYSCCPPRATYKSFTDTSGRSLLPVRQANPFPGLCTPSKIVAVIRLRKFSCRLTFSPLRNLSYARRKECFSTKRSQAAGRSVWQYRDFPAHLVGTLVDSCNTRVRRARCNWLGWHPSPEVAARLIPSKFVTHFLEMPSADISVSDAVPNICL